MRNFLILFLLNFFDFFHKKKILFFLKKKGFSNFKIFFDIGAHKGETINLFIKNFKIENIYSFEASPINFEDLKKTKTLLKKFNIVLKCMRQFHSPCPWCSSHSIAPSRSRKYIIAYCKPILISKISSEKAYLGIIYFSIK